MGVPQIIASSVNGKQLFESGYPGLRFAPVPFLFRLSKSIYR